MTDCSFTPGNKSSTVKTIERWNAAPTTAAIAGESIGITLTEQIFVERGAVGSTESRPPYELTRFKARIFWLGRKPFKKGQLYNLKLATQEVDCEIESHREGHRRLHLANASPRRQRCLRGHGTKWRELTFAPNGPSPSTRNRRSSRRGGSCCRWVRRFWRRHRGRRQLSAPHVRYPAQERQYLLEPRRSDAANNVRCAMAIQAGLYG